MKLRLLYTIGEKLEEMSEEELTSDNEQPLCTLCPFSKPNLLRRKRNFLAARSKLKMKV
jgi:hypothetical protein